METTVSSQAKKTKKRVACIGRWMPIHNGHKKFLVELAKSDEYDKVIIMIGSCYEGGNIRNCITATEREKMLRAIMKREGIPDQKYVIVPVPDVPTFDEWILNIVKVCKKYGATHFCTGNKEDILNVLEAREEKLDMEFINPEDGSDFPYHATDIRNMIVNGDYAKLETLIPNEIKPILYRYTFKEIVAASQNRGINFIKGRQTVDLILLVKDVSDDNVYVLLGNRPKDKKDFPEALALPGDRIKLFETATDAAIRTFYEETGLHIKMMDNSLEPAIVKFENVSNTSLEQMHMVGIYGTSDQALNGTQGGSSQCFAILVEGKLENFTKKIKPLYGLTNVQFYDARGAAFACGNVAFQHREMIRKALQMLEAYPDLPR